MTEDRIDPNWEYYLETGEDPTGGELSGSDGYDEGGPFSPDVHLCTN